MTIDVLSPGAQTTVQDAGRLGYFRDGVAPAGPQDPPAFRLANALAGNGPTPGLFAQAPDRGAAGLEMTMQGPRLRFATAMRIAVTGADMQPTLDGVPMPMWTSVEVPADAVLEFKVARTGLRAYLAVAGGIDVPVVMGSRATCLVARLGGFAGRVLRAGDRLATGLPAAPGGTRALAPAFRGSFPAEPALRVLPGPQDHLFTEESVAAFFASPWKMSPVSNRMGFRFDGPALSFKERAAEVVRDSGSDPSNIVDDMIPLGGIQIAGGKQAIIMGVEAPSVGGYAKIGTVISADFGVLGQMRPGQSARFLRVSSNEAEAARRSMEDGIDRAIRSLEAGAPAGEETGA